VSYGHTNEMTWGYGPECNKILGSDGVSTPPFIKPDRVFYMFVPGLCRSLKFKYETDVNYLGIPGYRFTVPKEYFGDPRSVPENRCYCSGYPSPIQSNSRSISGKDTKEEEVKKQPEESDEDDFGFGFDDDDESEEEESRSFNEEEDNEAEKKEEDGTVQLEPKAAVENLDYLGTCPKEGVWELSACRKGKKIDNAGLIFN